MTDSDRFKRLESLFHELETLPAEERRTRLEALVAEDAELHAELVRLLEPSERRARDERALDSVAGRGGLAASIGELSPDLPADPEVIGPYRLVKPIGEGGMGRVYLAEQDEPVQRRVALKLTRRGLDSQEAMARFRAERQALAVLDHPNIARVFDAGSTDDGRPWFAMEYIEGVPITTWAAERGLGLAERIELLLPVCEAVQHAHRKGLIHRDLKPSNILVVDQGGQAVPKVIDFGIARLLQADGDDRTQVTRLGELIGTPEYMSPEQAALGEIDIDTRSDVYSLGLVLYELLVGTLPMTGKELRALGFEAMCRQIREGDTPRPSRMQPAAETLSDATTQRWRSRLKGDLDSVLLKALAKDRERRYGSAADLADDLKRYLVNEPVIAQPPSMRYRAGKFVRRHRWPVAAGTMVALALLVGSVVAVYGLQQARDALRQSEVNLEEARLLNSISNAYADALQRLFGGIGDVEVSTRLLVEHVEERTADWPTDPQSAALTAFAVGRHFLSRNDYPTARRIFEPWLQAGYGSDTLQQYGWSLIGYAYRYTGERDKALAAFRQADAMMPPEELMRTGAINRRVQIALMSGEATDFDQARDLLQRRIDSGEVSGAQKKGLLNSLYQLEVRAGNFDAAYRAIRAAVDLIEASPGMEFAGRDTNRLNLAAMDLYYHEDPAAARHQVEVIRGGAMRAKGESREAARALLIEGVIDRLEGRPDSALEKLREAIPLFDRFAGANPSDRLNTGLEIVVTLIESGRLDDAERELAGMRARARGPGEPAVVLADAYLALAREGASAASERLNDEAFDAQATRNRDYGRYHLDRLQGAGASVTVED